MKKYGVERALEMECPECDYPLHKINGKWVCLNCEAAAKRKDKKNKPPRKQNWK
jgi:uncharacterized Zn finger protein (UPF0148 family)